MTPILIGRSLIKSELGRGGIAVVYRAKDSADVRVLDAGPAPLLVMLAVLTRDATGAGTFRACR